MKLPPPIGQVPVCRKRVGGRSPPIGTESQEITERRPPESDSLRPYVRRKPPAIRAASTTWSW